MVCGDEGSLEDAHHEGCGKHPHAKKERHRQLIVKIALFLKITGLAADSPLRRGDYELSLSDGKTKNQTEEGHQRGVKP